MKTASLTKWKRIRSGLYEHTGKKSGDRYQAERLDRIDTGEKTKWMLRVNGKATDTEKTFDHLKLLVEHYEAEFICYSSPQRHEKPLIDIL